MADPVKPVNLYRHELLHGAWLAIRLFDEVGKSGEACGPSGDSEIDPSIFMRHPAVKAAFETAAEALGAFYQACGEMGD